MIKPVVVSATALLLVLALSGCGVNRYCVNQQPYQVAGVVPELRAAGELDLPQSPSALRLPPPPASRTPFGQTADDGTISCLDQPPPMPESERPEL